MLFLILSPRLEGMLRRLRCEREELVDGRRVSEPGRDWLVSEKGRGDTQHGQTGTVAAGRFHMGEVGMIASMKIGES